MLELSDLHWTKCTHRVSVLSHVQRLGLNACLPISFDHRLEITMLSWAVTFFVVAIIAGVLGLGGIAGSASSIAYALFVIFLIFGVIAVIRGRRPPL